MSLHFFVCFICQMDRIVFEPISNQYRTNIEPISSQYRTIIESHHRYPSVTTKNRYTSSPKLIFHSRGVFPDQCLN